MILDFKVKNYNSIRNKICLDFKKKSKEKNNQGTIANIAGEQYLKVLGLIGVNGAGKSSILEALLVMQRKVMNSHNNNVNTLLFCPTFLGNRNKRISFEIIFVEKKIKYRYAFSYDKNEFINEEAHVYHSNKSTLIFKRDREKYQIGKNYQNELIKKSQYVTPKNLLVSRAVQLNSQDLKPIYDFFVRIVDMSKLSLYYDGIVDFSKLSDKNFKEDFLHHLYNCDFSIQDLELVENEIEIPLLPPNAQSLGIPNNFTKKKIKDLILVHQGDKNPLKVLFRAESTGTKKLIYFFYHLSFLQDASVVLFDELENSFNLEIILYILDYFSKKNHKHQLLFTTHSYPILNELRSDQIKIVEKDRENSVTSLYNLYDKISSNSKIKDRYGDWYNKGVLGAQPNVILY